MPDRAAGHDDAVAALRLPPGAALMLVRSFGAARQRVRGSRPVAPQVRFEGKVVMIDLNERVFAELAP